MEAETRGKEETQIIPKVKAIQKTRIKKVVLEGFKSFAKYTELLMGDEFNIILGPNGSGKCVTGDTKLQLPDGSFIKIADLVNKKIQNNLNQKLDDGFLAYGDGTKILCLDTNTLKIVEKPIQAFIKRKAPEQLLKIRTRSGREITATEYHPLFVLKDGKIQSIKAEELKEGQRVAVPRIIPIKSRNKYFTELLDLIKEEDKIYVPFNDEFVSILNKMKKTTWNELSNELNIPLNSVKGLLDKQSINFSFLVKILRYSGLDNISIMRFIPKIKSKTSNVLYKVPWKNSKEFARFFGYLLAEGRFPLSSDQIWFTNGEENIVRDYFNLITFLFGLRATINEYKPNCWDVLAYSAPIRIILNKMGMAFASTKNKKITNLFLSHSSDEELWQFLNGFLSGDGYVSKNSIEFVTKSKELAFCIRNILLRLGIHSTSKDVIKIATNSGFSGLYTQVIIYSLNNFKKFYENMQFVHKKKQLRLCNIIKTEKSNPNTDLIEVNSLVKQAAKELKINIKKTKKKFPKLDAYCYNQCTPSRQGVQELMNNLFLPVDSTQLMSLTLLDLYANSDIFWDEITSLETIKTKDKWVYDLTVEHHHNFIANNFIVHNSNVLDALCFVLGKSSSKSLRAEKSANLIYNGGKTKNPSKQAEVSIWLDNSDKAFPLPDDEIKISRIVRKEGTSKYKINNKTCTRAEILELLSSVKVNPDGYNIILQGDITRLIEMSAIERRQVIEEIAGIGVYEEKKNQALNELAKVENKLNEAEIILKERESYLKDLKKDRNHALKHKELTNKIKQNKATFCHIQIEKKKKGIEDFKIKIDRHAEKLDKADDEIAKLKQVIAVKKKEIDDIAKEIEDKSEKDQINIQKQVENLRVEIATKKTKISDLENEKSKFLQRLPQLEQNLKILESKKKDIDEKKAELNAQKSAIQKTFDDLSQKVEAFRKKHNIDDIVEIEKEMDSIEKDIEVKQKDIEDLRAKQQNFLREKDKIDFQLQTIDDQLKKIKNIKNVHKEEIKILEQKKKEFEKVLNELNQFLESDSKSAALLGQYRKQINLSQEELAKLKVKQAAIKESIQANSAVKKILQNKNKFGGVFGTVADIASVDEKFSLALEVAASYKMHSIVVENEKIAAECISFLKSQKLGVATFLPLNKIKPAQVKESAFKKINGVLGLAINLVSFDPKFHNAFSHIFGNTLVVKDLDTAKKVGINSIRMVTLDGDLVEKSGAMSGGFRAKKVVFKGKNLEKNIKDLEGELKNFEKKINKLTIERQNNEDKIFKLREFKANIEGDIIKTEKSLHLESGEIEGSETFKKDLIDNSKKINKDIEDVENNISGVMGELTQLKIKKQEFKNKLTSLRSPIILAELNAFEEKRKDLTTQLIKVEGEVNNLDLQVSDVFDKDKENTEKSINELKKEVKDFDKIKNSLEKEIKSLEKDLKIKEEEQAKFMTQFKSLFEKRNKLSEGISEFDNKLLKFEETSRKEELTVNSLSIEQARFKTEFKGLELEFEQYEGIELNNKPEEQLKKEISSFERSLATIGSVNMRALEIFETVEKEYNSLLAKKSKLSEEKKSVVELMDEIENNKKDLFTNCLDIIDVNFRNIFSKLTAKGEAYLDLENKEQPFEAGLRIKVKLTGEKFLDLRSLSGGEKTLTALAFLFSIQEHEPAPFYILDEVDAALDKQNSEKFAKLIRDYCKKAQYIVITHNDAVISEGDVLYGVSMKPETGISTAVSIKMS